VGSVGLRAPVLTASGTAGYGTELAAFGDLAELGALVTKSLSADPWPGNPAPRLAPTAQGMLNSVGLQGPGIDAWSRDVLPELLGTGADVVVSIWGRTVDEYRRAADLLGDVPSSQVVAVEVNLSCPNLESRSGIFAHDAELAADVISATEGCRRPRWAKLSANTDRIVDVATAVVEAGAEALTCVNTLLGLVYDPDTLRPALGAGGGGLSGRAIHPVAVRAVHDVCAALPTTPVVAVGGVASGWDAVEMLLAGATAVQVGTATFADPRAPWNVQDELLRWAAATGCRRAADIAALA
jgi:dihydroorotate dehydrogenase (NAD+) catalytic subunit